jgi:RimJ/RimL family protein N-acetyltransferase
MDPSPAIFATERLTLHQFSLADAAGFYALNLNPNNIEFTGDKPFADLAQTEQFIENYDQYRKHGFGRWSLYLKKPVPTYIGFCGLRLSEQTGEVDVGYRIDQKYWGKGYIPKLLGNAFFSGS